VLLVLLKKLVVMVEQEQLHQLQVLQFLEQEVVVEVLFLDQIQ
jgi:hypothetical protein